MNCILAFASFPLLISLEVVHSCPPICKYCSTGLAECEHISSLQEVLSGLPNSTEKILLRHGNLSKIPPLSFQNFPSLHLLSITGFLFSSLANLTFAARDGSSLRSLDLSRNCLLSCGIEHLAFSGLGVLEELILTNNALDMLKSSWFLEMTLLTKLLLSDNKITYLPPRTFESLTKLNELILSSNFIRYLSLDTFCGLASLTRLDLSSNEILFINNEVFQPLQALKHLWLFKNKLTALASIPDSITSLSLNENPWTCSCQLVSAIQLLKEKVQTPHGLVCNSPPSLRGRHVLRVGPEVCAFPTPTGNLPQDGALKFNWLYGFTGGLLFSFIMCLIVYFTVKHWKFSRVTNQEEDGRVSQKDSVEECPKCMSSSPSVVPPPHCCVGKAKRTKGQPEASEGDTAEKALCHHLDVSKSSRELPETSSPIWMAGVSLLPTLSHTGKKIMTICKEEMEIERCKSTARLQMGKRAVERAAEVSRCVSAPCILPGVEKEPSPKRDGGLHCPSFSHEKTTQTKEWMENGEPALVKYLETHCEEQALTSITWFGGSQCARTSVNVVSPAGSAAQIQTGRDGIHTTSNKRSKSWSPLHFISSHLTEAHGEGESRKSTQNEFETSSMHSTRNNGCETWCPGPFMKRESTDAAKDRSEDQGVKEPDLQKDISPKNCSIVQSEGNEQREAKNLGDFHLTPKPEAPGSSPPSDLASSGEYASANSPDSKGIKPAVKDKSVSPCLSKEGTHPPSFCNSDRLGEERLNHRIPRSEKLDTEPSLKNDKLTKESFWKYHSNCCNEHRPCPSAQKALKELKAALLSSRKQLDLSAQAPPSDTDLLKEQEVTTTLLALCQNTEEPLTNPWEKGNHSSLPKVHTSFAPDGICHQELPGDDSNISCGHPQTITVQLDHETDTSHQETGAEYLFQSKAIFEPMNDFQQDPKKCTAEDQRRMVDSSEQLQLGNTSSGAGTSENADCVRVTREWNSLDARTDPDAPSQTYNTINEHFAGGENGWTTASPSVLHGDLCPVKSLLCSAKASLGTYLPLSADERTLTANSRSSRLGISEDSLLDVHGVTSKGVADRESNHYLSDKVVLVQKMPISPREEENEGRLRDERAGDEFLLHENEGARFNIGEEKTKTFQSDCTEDSPDELVQTISSNDTDDRKNSRELVTSSDNLRINRNTCHKTDNIQRNCLENSSDSIAADCNECDGVGFKKETGHEYLCQLAASKGCSSSTKPVYEGQVEEIRVAGYDGIVSQSRQASRSRHIQQFAYKKDMFELQNIQVNPKLESEPDDAKYCTLVAGNTDGKLCVAEDILSACPSLESRQPLEIGLHSTMICLPGQSHKSLPQQDSVLSVSQKKELEQNWNENASAKPLKKMYYSVFKLPTEGSSFGKLCQNSDRSIELSGLNKSVSPTATLTPTPRSLGQETERHVNREPWAFDPQLMDKATYLSCLYNPKTPKKQANELSVLSNLRYCKISAEVSLDGGEGGWSLTKRKKK